MANIIFNKGLLIFLKLAYISITENIPKEFPRQEKKWADNPYSKLYLPKRNVKYYLFMYNVTQFYTPSFPVKSLRFSHVNSQVNQFGQVKLPENPAV